MNGRIVYVRIHGCVRVKGYSHTSAFINKISRQPHIYSIFALLSIDDNAIYKSMYACTYVCVCVYLVKCILIQFVSIEVVLNVLTQKYF